ncbi:MAG: hypothetical protein QGG42_06445 [Phycisphaerae bacterium]|nr:hypothetical protein [Phycisphaerae bacterium]
MKQAGLAGEFLADNETAAPAETQQTLQAIGVSNGPSSADESASAQKRANVVLAVLFLAGMAVVYFMSMESETTQANPLEAASETIVDAAVQQFQTNPGAITGPPPDTEQADKSPVELAREMITGTPERQIPLKELKNNPFLLVADKRARAIKPEATKPVGITPRVTALQRAEALQLQSIVEANDRSLAIISDRLLTVGQEIAGWRVHEIGDGQVVLKRKNLSYVLRVKQ